MKSLLLYFILVHSVLAFGQTLTQSDLPIVIINTQGGAPIVDDPRVVANMGIIDNGPGNINYITDPYTNYDGRIEIEIRGSTSQQYPKKNYALETQDSLGMNLEVSVLGMPIENDWILYGPYPDKTCIRNVLTFNLARQMGHYASDTRYCELVVNGNYRGLYVMMERIKRDFNRVNVMNLHDPVFNDTITGGYIMKVDKLTGEVGFSWASNYDNEVLFQFHDPEYDELYAPQTSYMINYIQEFEDAINGPNFADPQTGYPYYLDMTSFHDFFILQELGRTVDGYRSSSFFYKDKNSLSWNAKINAGPMWDFNLSYGNADYCNADLTTGWQYQFDNVCNFSTAIPFWWEKLLQDPNYANALRCRWEELRQGPLKTENIHQFIDSVALRIEDARIRNFQRWPIIGVYVNWNGFVGQTYQEDLDYLKDYIEQRALWMDNNIPGNCNLAVEEKPFIPEYHKCWPNPANEVVNIGYSLFNYSDNVKIDVYDQSGKIIYHSEILDKLPGTHIHQFSVSKFDRGSYFYQISDGTNSLYHGKLTKY